MSIYLFHLNANICYVLLNEAFLNQKKNTENHLYIFYIIICLHRQTSTYLSNQLFSYIRFDVFGCIVSLHPSSPALWYG